MSAPAKSAAQLLATPVEFLKGVGQYRAELLERLGLRTVRDLLFFFPRDYEDLTDRREIANLEEGSLQSVLGVVEDVELRNTGAGRCVLGVLVRGATGHLRGVWFNQPFLRDRFSIGQRVMFSGKPKQTGLVWEMIHPKVATLDDEEEAPAGAILPLYPLTEGLQQWQIRRIVREAIDAYTSVLEEVFPAAYLEAHDLWTLRQALPAIHFPQTRDALARARRRFVYQELLILQLALAVKRHQQGALRRAPPLEATAKIDARIRRLFPFELTPGQQEAIAAIAADMARSVPMNRLLQGDVGSGKTVVALYAMLLAVAHGYQAVLMAPTEVLARQHSLTLDRLLAKSQVRRTLLIGGLAPDLREAVLQGIAAGNIDLVVGTHAVIQQDVEFAKLGLVVIDEQHKFGVRQRALLKQAADKTGTVPLAAKGTVPVLSAVLCDPHYLIMTATPIPRTVTMSLFGDLDVSTLRDAPPGRQKVHTYLVADADRGKWWEFFSKKLREGRQGYVVTPLVEESEAIEAASLDAMFESLANGPLEAFRLGLVHGRMTSDQKDAAMAAFGRGETQVLVCTSVVEVGVDVPNATLMTIEGGERFGLAQLHQLRGRISRGSFAGFCGVFADPQTEEAQTRLAAFVSTTDGFRLAEIDFAVRGPGELFGTRQHGLPPFRIADLVRDAEILEEARRDAQALVAADPGLCRPDHARLRRQVLTRYGQALDLADVG
jgi:ATP-dependent DNA helicase RecG